MSVWLLFCFVWKIYKCSLGFLTTLLLEDVPSRVKNVTVLKKCLKTAKNGPFYYKNNETSSLSFEKLMLFKESHYGAKAPQNMMYKEQNKIKNTLLFQFYHPFKISRKMYPCYNFCQILAIFGYILTLKQKWRFTT